MESSIRSIKDFELEGKRVFIRVDFNCPLDEDRRVKDDSRIVASLPTIKYAIEKGARIVLASHLGRPKGKVVQSMSLLPVGEKLAEHLNREVLFPEDCIGDAPKKLLSEMKEGEVMLLENLRFHAEEEENDDLFSMRLAELGDLYINDAFGASHRAHASVSGITRHVKECGAGLLMMKEIQFLSRLLHEPEQPFALLVGGAKVSDKIGILNNLLGRVQKILIGGAMANTFLAAKGYGTGKSKVETDKFELALQIINKAEHRGVEILLPEDLVVVKKVENDAEMSTVKSSALREDDIAVDIGKETIEKFGKKLMETKTIFWNGPLGVFEMDRFAHGTEMIARTIAKSSAMSVVGGGDSLAAINKLMLAPFFTHVSTGGGAALEFLEGRELPGIEALKRCAEQQGRNSWYPKFRE